MSGRTFTVEVPACKLCGEAPGLGLYGLCGPCQNRDDCAECGEPLDEDGLTVCVRCFKRRWQEQERTEANSVIRPDFGEGGE